MSVIIWGMAQSIPILQCFSGGLVKWPNMIVDDKQIAGCIFPSNSDNKTKWSLDHSYLDLQSNYVGLLCSECTFISDNGTGGKTAYV